MVIVKSLVKKHLIKLPQEVEIGADSSAREPSQGLTPGKRLILIERVRQDWIEGQGLLARLMADVNPLALQIKEVNTGIEPPLNNIVYQQDLPEILRPSEAITRIFDKFKRLLILGDPGSGKTVLLLELARELLERAENKSDPIPVIWNLTSWTPKSGKLDNWLLEELNKQSQIDIQGMRRGLDSGEIILLLDGLDEVKAEYREACFVAVNDFLRRNGSTLIAVCCRTADCKLMCSALGEKLRLRRTVELLRLTDVQARTCLDAGGEPLIHLRNALETRPDLAEFLKAPLYARNHSEKECC